MTDIRETRSFKTKKWFLFAICLIYIFFAIIILLNSDYSAEYVYEKYYDTEDPTNTKSGSSSGSNTGTNKHSVEDEKNDIKAYLRIVALMVIFIQFFGLIGAYKENRCLTLTYAIMMSMSAVLNIVSFLITFKNFTSLLMSVCITGLAFQFYRDLKQVGPQLGAYPMVTIQTAQPMPLTVIPMYSTTVIGYHYPQQQQPYNGILSGMGVYGGQPLPPNYSNTPLAYNPQNDYPTK